MIQGKNLNDRLFNLFNVTGMILLILLTLYPIWFTIICSLNDGMDLQRGYVFL